MPTMGLLQSENVYFTGYLARVEGHTVQVDRLGSVSYNGGTRRYYPYGVEYTATGNDTEKYATYTRDSATGLDYAVNRYYSSLWGRFLSPDPYVAGVGPADPGSRNRYTYTRNDPISRLDPPGLDDSCPGAYTILAPYPDQPQGRMAPYDPKADNWMNLALIFGAVGGRSLAPVVTVAEWDDSHPRAPNKGGYYTDPSGTGVTALQYLTTVWSNCLGDFSQDARFDSATFESLLKAGIIWLDGRTGSVANATIDSYAHNGDTETVGQYLGWASAVTLPGTSIIVVGSYYELEQSRHHGLDRGNHRHVSTNGGAKIHDALYQDSKI